MTVLPGPIRQIGYVVTDIDRAIASWLDSVSVHGSSCGA